MIRLSLCLFGGLSPDAERMLWQRGIFSWNDYRREGKRCFGSDRHARILAEIDEAEAAFARNDLRFFLKRLPRMAQTRVWPMIHDRVAYLDIETTGLAVDDAITTVAIYDGHSVRTFIQGQNLAKVAVAIPEDSVLVTYNGRRFDLPFLRRELSCRFPQPHVDLCPVMRAAGFGPGLKECERQLHVTRRIASGVTGADAVTLWQAYRAGDAAALQRLVAYNTEDALSLERLLVAGCNNSMRHCPVYHPIPMPQQSSQRISTDIP